DDAHISVETREVAGLSVLDDDSEVAIQPCDAPEVLADLRAGAVVRGNDGPALRGRELRDEHAVLTDAVDSDPRRRIRSHCSFLSSHAPLRAAVRLRIVRQPVPR